METSRQPQLNDPNGPLYLAGGLLGGLLIVLLVVLLSVLERGRSRTADPLAEEVPPSIPARPANQAPASPEGVLRSPAPRKARLVIDRVQVALTKRDGSPWDGGALKYTRPDPYVRVERHDPVLVRRLRLLEKEIAPLSKRENAFLQLQQLRQQRDRLKPGDPGRRDLDDQIVRLERTTQGLDPKEQRRLAERREEIRKVSARGWHATCVKEDRFTAVFDEEAFEVAVGDRLAIQVLDRDVRFDDSIGATTLTITPEHLANGRVTLAFDQVLALQLRFRARP